MASVSVTDGTMSLSLSHTSGGDGESRELEWKALSQLLRYPPELVVGALGEERYRGGVVTLFECLQCHTLNKQVSIFLLFPSTLHIHVLLPPSLSPSLLAALLHATGRHCLGTLP